jgi:hypothetical protein
VDFLGNTSRHTHLSNQIYIISQSIKQTQAHISYQMDKVTSRIPFTKLNQEELVDPEGTVLIEYFSTITGNRNPYFYESPAGYKLITCCHSENNGLLNALVGVNRWGMFGDGARAVRITRDFQNGVLNIDENLLRDTSFESLMNISS